jgi:O-antigen ligase
VLWTDIVFGPLLVMSLETPVQRAANPPFEAFGQRLLRSAVFVLVCLSIWVTVRPFSPFVAPSGVQTSGDFINQMTFAGLAGLCAVALWFTDRRAFLALLQPSYILLTLWIVFATVISTDPGISQRALQFAVIIIFITAAALVMPMDGRHFTVLIMLVAGLTVAVAYIGVIAFPSQGVHSDFDRFEPEHAGSWRGHFDHKNIAGAMMGILTIIGIFLLRSGYSIPGAAIALGALMFLVLTRSKTALALLPLVVLLTSIAEHARTLSLRLVLCLLPVLLMISITLGSVLLEPINAIVQIVVPGTTFTGRIDIWKYGFEKLAERPLTGFGFESFWLTATTLYGESKQELEWSVDKIVHGHNGYLDTALTLGIPGFLLVTTVFVIKPVLDFHRAARDAASTRIAMLFLMIWLYCAMGLNLESYFFRRSDPLWFALLFSVLGLRFMARHGVATPQNQS